jgi:hypothetical protein
MFLIDLLTLNSNMEAVFLNHPRVFCDSQLKCEKRVKKCVHISLENKI